MNIVLDTNCLLASLSRKSKYFPIWQSFVRGEYTLCVSTEILEEYEEIIATKTSPIVAENVIGFIINSDNVMLVSPYFHFNLVQEDPDDNKFVDCAICANASYIVSQDAHFNVLRTIGFPKVNLIGIDDFMKL